VVILHRLALCSFLIGVASSASAAAEIDDAISSAAFTEEHQALKDCANDLGGDFRQRFERVDLNRDGSDEVIVYTTTAGTSGCIGAVGQRIDLLIRDRDGRWVRNLGYGIDKLERLPRDDSDWPDLELTGPGFCFPIWRYHEERYRIWKTCKDGTQIYAEGIVDGAAPSGSNGAVASVELDVPIFERGGDGQAANCASSRVSGLKSDGDGYLSVRSGPGTQYRKIDELRNGDLVFVFEVNGDWAGVVYKTSSVRCSSTDTRQVPFKHRGWVHQNWLKDVAG